MKVIFVVRMAASYTDTGDYITLKAGSILDVISTRKRQQGRMDFVCDLNGRQVQVKNCWEHTFCVLDKNGNPPVPLFKTLRLKAPVIAVHQVTQQQVKLNTHTMLDIDMMCPNVVEGEAGYSFFCKLHGDNSKALMLISGLPRNMFCVVDGEGQSLWDDLDLI